MDSGTKQQTHNQTAKKDKTRKHAQESALTIEGWSTMPMSCHYMKDHCCCSCYLHINAAECGQKFTSFFPWFVCNKTSRDQLQAAKKKKVITWFIKRLGTGKLADGFYKRLSLLFQECRETSASSVVSQHWGFFLLFFFFLSSHSFLLSSCLTFFVLTTCTWRRKETLAA